MGAAAFEADTKTDDGYSLKHGKETRIGPLHIEKRADAFLLCT